MSIPPNAFVPDQQWGQQSGEDEQGFHPSAPPSNVPYSITADQYPTHPPYTSAQQSSPSHSQYQLFNSGEYARQQPSQLYSHAMAQPVVTEPHPSANAPSFYPQTPAQQYPAHFPPSMLSRPAPVVIANPFSAGIPSQPFTTSPESVSPGFQSLGSSNYSPLHYKYDSSPSLPQSQDMNLHPHKRHRSKGDYDNDGEDGSGSGYFDTGPTSQMEYVPHGPLDEPRLKRACVRCRGLKVRCEFRDDQDSCERCSRAAHECVIPGRKKRRPPPKREVLLEKIRDQAAQIEELMSQLEMVQNADQQTARLANTLTLSSVSSPRSLTRTLSTSGDGTSYSQSSAPEEGQTSSESLQWIAEAREKLMAFGGFIGLGGGNISRKLFTEEDPEDESSNDSDYDILVQDHTDSEDEAVVNRMEAPVQGMRPKRQDTSGSSGKEKMSSIPTEASPFGLMATLSVKQPRTKRSSSVSSDRSDVGVAHEDFFRPTFEPDPFSPTSEESAPPLLRKNIITPAEAEKLFNIYFDYMNASCSLLDPVLYTAQKVYIRSPFLFTVICAIASRYYDERPDLYPTAIDYARQEAGMAFTSGPKRVETVQAYILLSLYPTPVRRWEEDRCWIYLGHAIRTALDMNLHHPNTAKPQNEEHAREMLNRTRTWLNCVNLDRSMGSQYGKVPVIRNTDFVAKQSATWWNSSEFNMENFDLHTCVYNAELMCMAEFLAEVYSDPKHPTGLNKEINLERLAIETDDKLERLRAAWFARLDETDKTNAQNRYRTGLLKLAYSYARLLTLSYGFQHAFGKNEADDNPFLIRCIRAASDVVSAMVDDIGIPSQRIYLRHGPEAQTVFVTFGCTFMIKLLQPKYTRYITPDRRKEITDIVQRAVDFLDSPDIAIDDRHGPRLYSRFIRGLLASVRDRPPVQLVRRSSRRNAAKTRVSQAAPEAPTSAMQNIPAAATIQMAAPQPPQHPMTSDDYASAVTGQELYMQPSYLGEMDGLGLAAADFFRQPMPFELEFLQSMQSISSLSDMMPAGFGWMGQMPPLESAPQLTNFR